MKLGAVLDQAKASPEFVVKRLGVVTDNVQATALGRALRTKCCNDDVPAWLDRMSNLSHIGRAVTGVGKKVKDRPVMPHVKLVQRKTKCQSIAAEPGDLACVESQSSLGDIQGSGGKVHRIEVAIAYGQQIVNQG